MSDSLQSTAKPASGEGFLVRLGQARPPGERTFWVLGHRREDFEAAADLVEAVMARYPRVDILFTAPQAQTRAWLRERYPRGVVLPPPLPLAFIGNRFLVNLNVRGILVLGAPAAGDAAALKAAAGRAIPAAAAELPGAPLIAGGVSAEAAAAPLAHRFVSSESSRERLLEAGADGARITLLPPEGDQRAAAFMEVIAYLLAQDLKLIRSKQRPFRRWVERTMQRCLGSPRLRGLLAAKVRRFDSLEELRRELGDPQTILCLGNGPTSEDPAVGETPHDCLFRVNDLWLSRGFLTKPDMVFTGSKGTLSLVKGAIFGLYSIKSEARLLVAPLLRPTVWRFRCATIERFNLFLSEPRWAEVRPTNGAVMLATAVALQPARLVISGIDLFSHPAGSYPGDTTTPNAYTPGHNAESELAILLEALSLYQGELTILSPALREQWEAFKNAPVEPGKRRQDAT